ncbi:hypothetical protein MUP79_09380 [Candidatus Bathyarchaeota archaeon]|jgi:hypothetical protein|nr:hypothetical protein [Candidatus Bathyarchaeota archaeon]
MTYNGKVCEYDATMKRAPIGQFTEEQRQRARIFLYDALDQAIRENREAMATSIQKEINKIEGEREQ